MLASLRMWVLLRDTPAVRGTWGNKHKERVLSGHKVERGGTCGSLAGLGSGEGGGQGRIEQWTKLMVLQSFVMLFV